MKIKHNRIKRDNMPEVRRDFGIISCILGLISILFFWMPLVSIPAGLLAIIFFLIQTVKKHTGLATTGLILGILGLILTTIFIFAAIYAIKAISERFVSGINLFPFPKP